MMLRITQAKPVNGKLVLVGCLLFLYSCVYIKLHIIIIRGCKSQHSTRLQRCIYSENKEKKQIGMEKLSLICVGLFGKENKFAIIADLLMFAVVLIILTQTKWHLIWEKLLWTCNLKRREMEQTFFMQCLGCG